MRTTKGKTRECPFCKIVFIIPRKGPNQVCCSYTCAVKFRRDNPLKNYKVDKNGCWNWTKSLNNTGCGSVYRDGVATKAHRYFYEKLVGKIPEGLYLLHSCDNRACVNPSHLRPGTAQENSQDAVDRNRIARGERIGPSKLTNIQVKEIKKILKKEYKPRSYLLTNLAKQYHVSRVTIDDIRKGVWWGWLKV